MSTSSQAHLLGRLRLLEGRARDLVADAPGVRSDPLAGAYLTSEHVMALVERGLPTATMAEDPARAALEAAADQAEAEGATLSLRVLAANFGLDDLDQELLLAAAAPEIDARFEYLYGLLNDDATLRRATAGLALRLAGAATAEVDGRARLGPRGRLVAGGLLLVTGAERPFPTRALRVPDRVVEHLLGGPGPDTGLEGLLVEPPPVSAPGAPAVAAVLGSSGSPCYVRVAIGGSGHAFGQAVAAELGVAALCVDLGRPAGARDAEGVAEQASAALREARLRGVVLVLGPAETVATAPGAIDRLLASDWPIVLTGARPFDPAWSTTVPLLTDAPPVTPAELASLCSVLLPEDAAPATATLLAPYTLTPEDVVQAVTAATLRAALADRAPTEDDLRAGARARSAVDLGGLTRHVEPTASWSTLVLPPAVFEQLEELRMRVVLGPVVLDQWGLRAASRRGSGVTALFCGPSGTGKTLSAEVIAGALGVDLFTVDLSSVVDKYIGETEKNLERIFDRAERIHGVLFFDEADALFGKRSEVKDAHDRYANIETAYLLQRIEAFEGLVVLATNLRANLDEAFTRRLDFIIDFPVPAAADRRRLWPACLGPAPLGDDVDLGFLAERFEMAGGNIRNAALTAAFFAAESGESISMPDLVWAVQREYKKLGRLCTEQEFGTWWKVIAA